MKKRIKKALLLLASVGVLTATVVCVGCKKAESPGPQFLKGILKEIELGEGITLSHYIQYATDSGYTITISKGDYSKDITNKKYWAPDEPGVYTVTYTVEEGEFKGTNSFELTVRVPAISWTYTLDNTIYDVGDTLLFADYIKKMNISVQSYYDWEVVMDSVSTGTGEVSLADKDSWTFTDPGGHRFKFHVESEDGQTISMSQTVNVRLFETEMKAWMEQNNVSFYNALRLENDHSILLEEGIYNRDGSTLNPRADNTYEKDMPYVVFNGEYGFNDFVVVDFTGNNMPYVLFFGDEMTNSVIYKEAASDAQNKGLVFSNGWTYGTGQPSTSWTNSINTRYCAHGPQKIYTPGEDEEGWFRYRVDGATAMGMTSIVNDGPEDQYRLVIGVVDGTSNSFTVAVHCLNITRGLVLFSGQQTITLTESEGSFGENYFTGNIGLYGHFGKRTQLDKVYAIEEDTTLEDVKEKYCKVSQFNQGASMVVYAGKTLNVSDYITPASDAAYTLNVIDANGASTAITGKTFVLDEIGRYTFRYYDGVNIATELKVVVVDPLQFKTEYDFEDGNVPDFIYNSKRYSTNGTKSIEGYNGSNALKMTGDKSDESFEISAAYMDWAFANKFAAITFDITVEFAPTTSNQYITLGYVGEVLAGWERLKSGVTDTITITKKMYDEWKTSNLAEDYFRFTWKNDTSATGTVALTWYIDNLKVQESTLIENFDSFVSRAVYQGGAAPTDVKFVGFYYTSSSGKAFNEFTTDSNGISATQSARVYSKANSTLTSATQDGALCLAIGGGGHLYWHIPVSFLDYVFGVDEKVEAFAYDLACYSKPYGSYTVNDFANYPFTVDSYTVKGGEKTSRDSGTYGYMDYTEVKITRAEWEQMKRDGVETIMFHTTTSGIPCYTSAVQVMIDNFRFVLKNNA